MEPDDYFLEIEARFAERRGTPFIFSAKDWALARGWQDDGVPLSIVIEAIDTVFERNESSGRRKVISSLSYCRHAVKELWNERKELYVGGHEVAPEAATGTILEELAAAIEESASSLQEAPASLLRGAAATVRTYGSQQSVPRIEESLMQLEHSLIEELTATLPASELESVRAEVRAALAGMPAKDDATRRRTEEANLRRVVRERFNLPRLSLFG